jgi:DNA-binding MarR family transcriptional regulator
MKLLQHALGEEAFVLPEKHDGAVAEPAAVRLWLRLQTCSLTIDKRIRRRLAESFKTTLPRFDVLSALDRHPRGMTMGELSQALLVSGGNLTGLVRELERQGLVTMQRDAHDRRSWLVAISPSGRKHFAEIEAEHHHWIGDMFSGMPAGHRQRLYDLLDELKHSLAAASRA